MYLQEMKAIWSRGLIVVIGMLAALSSACAGDVPLKGINATVWYTWPRFNGWDKLGLFLPPLPPDRRMPVAADFQHIAGMGFSAIRLGVDPSFFLGLAGVPKHNALRRIALTVEQAIDAGLVVVFDLHPNSRHSLYGQKAFADPSNEDAVTLYADAVKQAAQMLQGFPAGKVLLELMNEPRAPCSGARKDEWPAFVDKLVQTAGSVAPELPLVLSGGCASSIEGLLALDASRWSSRNLYFTFHFYEPFPFTHQSAPFIAWPEKYLAGLPWPPRQALADEQHLSAETLSRLPAEKRTKAADDAKAVLAAYASSGANKESLRARLALVAQWADRNGIRRDRVFMGEFGVYAGEPGGAGARCEDRAAWVADVLSSAREFGFSWSYFHLDGPFGLLRGSRRTADPALLKALGLASNGKCEG